MSAKSANDLSATADQLMSAAEAIGFAQGKMKGCHARWVHPDGRTTTIPTRPDAEIGNWLCRKVLKQIGMTEEEFDKLR